MTAGEMSIPERAASADGSIVVDYVDSTHRYFMRKPYDRPVVSVTGIIGAYDKPALPFAAANLTIESVAHALADGLLESDALDAAIVRLRQPGPRGGKPKLSGDESDIQENAAAIADILYRAKLRHFQIWRGKADRGTFVHAINQAWVEYGTVPKVDDVPGFNVGCITAFGNFLRAHEPKFLTSEAIVASVKHGYAGRYDVTMVLTKRCDVTHCACGKTDLGSTLRVDYKTSKGVYAMNMAQLDLYEIAAVEMGEPQADHRVVLQLPEWGQYAFELSRLPFGKSAGLITGYRAAKRVERIHEYLNPRRSG